MEQAISVAEKAALAFAAGVQSLCSRRAIKLSQVEILFGPYSDEVQPLIGVLRTTDIEQQIDGQHVRLTGTKNEMRRAQLCVCFNSSGEISYLSGSYSRFASKVVINL